MNAKPDTLRERVFDAIVDLHGTATMTQLKSATGLPEGPLRTAILCLRKQKSITGRRNAYVYELTETAARPTDMRGRKRR